MVDTAPTSPYLGKSKNIEVKVVALELKNYCMLTTRQKIGINLLNFKLASVDVEKLNKGKEGDDVLPPVSEQPGLYEEYKQWGIISEEEALKPRFFIP